jgi:hypothetical protein
MKESEKEHMQALPSYGLLLAFVFVLFKGGSRPALIICQSSI